MRDRLLVVTLLVLVAVACGGPSVPPPATVGPSEVATAPAPAAAPAEPEVTVASPGTLIAEFGSTDRINALGGEFGAWASENPLAKSEEEVVLGQGTGGTGAWRIKYDISVGGSYGGAWMRLQNFDASQAKQLHIALRGEGEFTRDLIVELKAGEGATQKVGRYIVRGVTDQFQTFTIPLNQFAGLTEFKPLYELTLVFDEQTCPVRKGTILVDRISIE